MKRFFILTMALLSAITALGYDFSAVNNDGATIYYNITSTDPPEVEVTYGGSYTGVVNIPEYVLYNDVTYSVIGIASSAFYNNVGLTSITIPSTITYCEYPAFKGCSGLISVYWNVINATDYNGYSVFENLTSITTVIFGNSVETIPKNAFSGCTGITSLTLPSSLTTIEKFAFYNTGITSVTIPSSVTSIGESAFGNCTSLSTVNWNAVNVIYSDRETFIGCTGLTTVIFGDAVQTIPDDIFVGRTSITSITISSNVTNVGYHAFGFCTGLTTVNWNAINAQLINESGRCFYGCTSITNVVFGNEVQTIPNYVFLGCTSITSLTLPNSLKTIERYAFCNTGITSVTIPSSVISVGQGVFNHCTSLTTVNWNAINPQLIDGYYSIFYECTNLTNVVFGNEVEKIPCVFGYCTGIASITIPNSVTTIGIGAFYNCTGLNSITIPNSVTSIEKNAFVNCTGIQTLTLGNSVTTIGTSAFSGCSGITSPLVIPNSTQTIANNAFYNCSGITSISIGSSIIEISANAFYNLSNLSEMHCYATTPPFTGADVFYHVPYSMVLKVPAESVNVYKRIHPWSCFDIVGLTSQMVNIDNAIANGTVTTSPSGYVIPTTLVTISPTPNLGYALESVSVYKTSEPTTIVTVTNNSFVMPDYDVTVTATFNESSAGLNYLTMQVSQVLYTQDVPVAIGMNNESEITAIQFDITIPNDYYSVSSSDFTLGNRFSDHTLGVAQQNASTWRVVIASNNNQLISGNTGTIVNMTIHPNEGTPAGTYRCSITEAVLSNTNANDCYAGLLPVLDFTTINVGDANGDGDINVLDMVATANYAMGNNPSPFVFVSADINNDNTINVLDIVGICNIILGIRFDGDCHEMFAEYIIENGILYLNTPVDIAGLQFDFDGEYRNIELLETLPGFEWQQAQMSDGTNRFMLYSLHGNTINAGKHALLNIGDVTMNNIVLADANGCEVTLSNEVTAISDISFNNLNRIYPNPFSESVTISYNISNGNHNANILITNMLGQVIDVVDINAASGEHDYRWIPSESLAPGIYYVMLQVDGSSVKSFKLVKSK